MKRLMLTVAVGFLLVGCGKNDGLSGYPYPGFTTAPVPPNGGYPVTQYNPYGNYYPNGGYPQVGYPYNTSPGYNNGGYGGNTFQPSNMPYGYNNRYTPWMPLHQWMQQNPYRYQYYQSLLNNWYYYAQQRGYNRYDFSGFWLDYCRNHWNNSSMQPIYDYFSINVYPWVSYQTNYPQNYNSNYYWSSYSGFPYSYLDSMYSSYNWNYPY